MKKTTLLLSLLVFCVLLTEAQITLTQSNFPLKNWTIHTYKFPKLSSNPTVGTGTYWADTITGKAQGDITYSADTSSFFPSNSYYTNGLGSLASISYSIYTYWRESSNGVFGIGYSCPYQVKDISSFTSTSGDSLYFLSNRQIYSPDSFSLMTFPATYKSAWKSITRHVVNIKVTVKLQSLNKAPGQLVLYQHHRDTVIGWGTMSVHAAGTPNHSLHYAVLMNKVMDFNIDSFYLNSKPANSLLLSGFGLSQGEKSAVNCSYQFYRANNLQALMTVNYSSDSSYTAQTSVIYNTDSLQVATSNEELSKGSVISLIYPNPVKSNNVTVKMLGYDGSAVNCRVYDITGHEILNTRLANTSTGTFNIPVSNEIANGLYILQMSDLDNAPLLSESLMVQR